MDPAFDIPPAKDAITGFGGLSIRGAAGSRNAVLEIALESQFQCIGGSIKELSLKHNRACNVFQIPLKTIFITALKSVGIVDPDFKLTNCGGCFLVTITLMVGPRKTTSSGDLCKTPELAEAAAIQRAIVQLSNLHNICIVDISARKHKEHVRIGRAVYEKVLSKCQILNWFLWKWNNCLNNLSAVELCARHKMKEGNRVDMQYADILFYKLTLIRGSSLINLQSFDEKITALVYEKNRYHAASRSKVFSSWMIGTRKAYFPDVESLALLLQLLGLDECKYSAQICENELWIGVVEVCLTDGNVSIAAKQEKSSIPKAYNAAAREVISYLEDKFNVDVCGFNHSACVLDDQENFVWKGLNHELFMMARAVLKSWHEMILKLGLFIKEQKNTLNSLGPDSIGEMANLVNRLDTAKQHCCSSFKVAVAKFASLD